MQVLCNEIDEYILIQLLNRVFNKVLEYNIIIDVGIYFKILILLIKDCIKIIILLQFSFKIFFFFVELKIYRILFLIFENFKDINK